MSFYHTSEEEENNKFIFNNRTYQTAPDVTISISKHGGAVHLFNDKNGEVLSMGGSDFTRFISDEYNGNDIVSDWVVL